MTEVDAVYGRGYLMGQARAYRRGTVTLNAVRGGISVARRGGLPDADIAEALRGFGITWDSTSGELRAEPD